MLTFRTMIHDAARFLERNQTCSKHHLEHTGSTAYLLDFYDYLGEIENGKKQVTHLLSLIVDNPTGGKVFYPGHLNPMNMSQNVIDTGTTVDAISRFMHRRRDAFSEEEHATVKRALAGVVDSYLTEAAFGKKITNQRLWGLTGIASYARYVGRKAEYRDGAQKSIEQAFVDMTPDGFFRYFPDPEPHLLQYDDITTFYQSRHTAFIEYVIALLGIDRTQYAEQLELSNRALLSMYDASGRKDLRMECKRWYWLSSYEVASHSFDAFALAHANDDIARVALHNVLYQVRKHFYNGFLHSHMGVNLNFQCPIFWTAHMAWLTRIPDIENRFESATQTVPFSYTMLGKEIITKTTPEKRTLINSRWNVRNPTTGILNNGLPSKGTFTVTVPQLPHAYWFSAREALNHARAAMRGFRVIEAIVRVFNFLLNSVRMLIPWYTTSYGKIEHFEIQGDMVEVKVHLSTKYGSVQKTAHPKQITIQI